MKSAAIFSKPAKPELGRIVPELLAWLKKREYEVFVDRETATYAPGQETVERSDIAKHKPNFVVVLGGDGTLLSAARAVAKDGIPVLGVNLGSLGFLTEVPLSDLYSTVEAIDQKRCSIEGRSMLSCEVVRDGKGIARHDALNDVVVNKTAIARLSDFDLYIDQEFVSNYKADGVIVATPTGSTAYSLAAGGPILVPSVEAFVITPVSPHALTHRPIVVPDTAEIVVVIKSAEEQAFLSVDGQVGMPVLDGDRVSCRKSENKVKLLRLKRTFFDILRTKLKWGQR
jgi:NAD+ kinase